MEEVTDALVLRGVDYRDNDKILTLFSADKGKITAGIRGVRKNGAKLRFSAEPFAFCEYVLIGKAGRYTVAGATLHDGFFPLRTDLEKYYAACSVLEVCDRSLTEGMGGGKFFLDAVSALRDICYGEEKTALVSFLLRAVEFSGFMLDLTACGTCGERIEPSEKLFFDFSTGRFSCGKCMTGVRTSGCTYELLKKYSSLPFSENLITPDAPLRAIRLLRTYFCSRTETELAAVGEYLKLVETSL